jgi:phosphoglycolate phosphatase
MVRLILFDIDGTLIRTGGAGVKAFERTFASVFGLPDATRTVKFAGRTDTSIVRECFTQHQIPCTPENFAKFFEMYPFWLDQFLSQLEGGVCEGVADFMEGVRKLPEPPVFGLLTGNIRVGAEIKLRHYGLWQHFRTGAFGDDDERRDCIAGIAKQRGSFFFGRDLAGDEVLVIGDTPHDITCGRSIGAKIIAVGTGGATLEELAPHHAHWTVPDLRELSAAECCGFADK